MLPKTICTLLIINVALSGCSYTTLSAATPPTGEGGLYSNADPNNPAMIVSDTDITGRILTAYFADEVINEWSINVDTYNGVVTLGGVVDNMDVANKAIHVARNIEGVKAVVPQLTIHPQKESVS